MTKIGIELGIRAPIEAIKRAAQIADDNSVEYFFVKIKNVNFLIRDGSVTDVLSHSRKILASSSLNAQFL